MDYMASIVEKIVVERNKKVDSAILGEIQQIAVENGIETKIILNEKNVADALKKQIPQKPFYEKRASSGIEWYQCATCGQHCIKRGTNYCHNCGQALAWEE